MIPPKSPYTTDWTIAELQNLVALTQKYGIDWFNKNYSLTRKPKEYLFWARPGGYLDQLTLAGDTLKSLGPYKSETIYSIFSSPDRQHLWMISNCYKISRCNAVLFFLFTTIIDNRVKPIT